MSSQLLLLDRVEYSTVKIVATDGDDRFKLNNNFPQLEFDFSKVGFLTRSNLGYPHEEAEDPRHFALTYGVKIDDERDKGIAIPYSIEVEVVGFFRYVGGDEYKGADRFRAVRFSGYQILYGAIRELVCNLTARGRHGIWQLPARTFGAISQQRADEDEAERQGLLAGLAEASAKAKPRIGVARKKRAVAGKAKKKAQGPT